MSNAASWTSAIRTIGCSRARAASAWMPKSSTTSRSSVSGLLVEKFGGPSVQAVSTRWLSGDAEFSQARVLGRATATDLYRRGVYTDWQRTFLHPSLLTFDAPTREECTVNRVNSNTPLQALDAAERSDLRRSARVFAQNIVKEGGAHFDAQLDWAFKRALEPRAEAQDERRILTDCTARTWRASSAHPTRAAN